MPVIGKMPLPIPKKANGFGKYLAKNHLEFAIQRRMTQTFNAFTNQTA